LAAAKAESDGKKSQLREEIKTTRHELVKTLEEMRLNKKTIDKIV
jgi:RNA polymerase primary sigma factor